MFKQQHKKKFQFPSQIALTLLLVALITAICVPLVKKINQKSRIDNEIDNLKAEVIKVEAKNSELKKMLQYLESDSFLEEQARLNFNLRKDGEKVVAITETPTNTVSSTINDKKVASANNLQKWIDYFFSPSRNN